MYLTTESKIKSQFEDFTKHMIEGGIRCLLQRVIFDVDGLFMRGININPHFEFLVPMKEDQETYFIQSLIEFMETNMRHFRTTDNVVFNVYMHTWGLPDKHFVHHLSPVMVESRRYREISEDIENCVSKYCTFTKEVPKKEELEMYAIPEIEKITQQDGWTIVKYVDGSHTRVHYEPDGGVDDNFIGFAIAILKKLYGDNKSFKQVQEMFELKSLPVKEQEKVLKAKAERKAKADKDMAKHKRRIARHKGCN